MSESKKLDPCHRRGSDHRCVSRDHPQATTECDRVPLLEHGMDPKLPPIHWALWYKHKFDSAARHIDESVDALDEAFGGNEWRQRSIENPTPSLLTGIKLLAEQLAQERAEHEITGMRLPKRPSPLIQPVVRKGDGID